MNVISLSRERLEELFLKLLQDTVEDDTQIREIAKKHGIDVEGSSYGVPGIVELVQQISDKVKP